MPIFHSGGFELACDFVTVADNELTTIIDLSGTGHSSFFVVVSEFHNSHNPIMAPANRAENGPRIDRRGVAAALPFIPSSRADLPAR